jgi:hypothetical protein
VLWYLRFVIAQQSEINAEFARRLTLLEGELRQGVAGELRAALERLAVLEGERHAVLERLAVLEGELRQGQDALKTQLSALSNELAAQQGHRAMTERIFAHQISCLTELTGSCLLAQAGQARSEQDLSSSTNS